MTDVQLALRSYLVGTALWALCGARIYAGRDVPPPGYKPGDGPAVCFKVRGGRIDDSEALIKSSVQFKCYGQDELQAERVYRTLFDSLHVHGHATIRWAFLEVLGQPMTEPQTGWFINLSFFQVWAKRG